MRASCHAADKWCPLLAIYRWVRLVGEGGDLCYLQSVQGSMGGEGQGCICALYCETVVPCVSYRGRWWLLLAT